MIAAISAGAEHSRHHPERPSVRKLNKRTVASTDNLLDPLPPPDERLHEGLVEKKIATGASVGHWEPRHALVSKDSFLLSRPTVHESVQALLGHFTSGDVAHCFAMANRDSSGGLSLSEWENAFGHIVTTQVLQQLFVIFDTDRNGLLSFEEFRSGLARFGMDHPVSAREDQEMVMLMISLQEIERIEYVTLDKTVEELERDEDEFERAHSNANHF